VLTPLHHKNVKSHKYVGILYTDNFIWNIEKIKSSSKRSTYKKTAPYFRPLDLLFILCTSDKKGPFNEHSYQFWFQLAQWFQRLKTNNTLFDTFGPLVYFVYIRAKKSFLEDHAMNIPTKFDSNWPSDFRAFN
jgi:hypothetical protein